MNTQQYRSTGLSLLTAHFGISLLHNWTKSAGRAPSWRVIPWHLPYNWGKTRKNLSQGSRRVLVYILPKRTRYKTHTYTPTHYKTHTYTHPHITKPTHPHTHTLQNPHIHTPTHYKTHTYTHPHITKPTHTHITKQFKTTTVQVKTNTVQDVRKWNCHNIIKYPQYKVNGTFIHKNFTVMHFTLSTRTSP